MTRRIRVPGERNRDSRFDGALEVLSQPWIDDGSSPRLEDEDGRTFPLRFKCKPIYLIPKIEHGISTDQFPEGKFNSPVWRTPFKTILTDLALEIMKALESRCKMENPPVFPGSMYLDKEKFEKNSL